MNSIERKSKSKLIFYICGISIPLLQFLFFYIFIVFDSVLMAFQTLEQYSTIATGFTLKNFAEVFKAFFGTPTVDSSTKLFGVFKNSLLLYVISLLFATPLNILFSNYLYKKRAGHKVFQIMLFLPQILSSVVMSRIFMFFASQGLNEVAKVFGGTIPNLLSKQDPNRQFIWLMVFRFWAMFGGSVLVYTSTMSGIPVEVVESAELDGITPVKELFHITLPMIYPTFVTFMVVNVASIFTDQMHLYTFYGATTDSVGKMSMGYYIFAKTMAWNSEQGEKFAYLSALGVTLSAIAIPTTLLAKKLLEKIGPSFE